MKRLLFISCLVSFSLFAKEIEIDTALTNGEVRIGKILTQLRAATDDAEKEFINIELEAELENLLEHPQVIEYPFESWTTMSTIVSPDGEFRIFNWNIEDKQLNHTHYCYVVKKKRGKKNQVFKFKENKLNLPPRPENTLTPDMWYGALYYKIIPVQKGSKTYYTVLGFSGKDRSSNMKLLDVFYFKGRTLRMGYPMFQESKDSKRLKRRVFFEYSEKAVVSVRLNEKLGGIVFDHLVPEQKNLEGLYSFYIPDMTYDMYKLVDATWRYQEDVIAYNDENRKIKQWRPTDGGNGSEYEEVKDFWIDPVVPGAIGGGNDATAPVVDVREKEDKKKSKRLKRKKDKNKRFRKKKNHSAINLD